MKKKLYIYVSQSLSMVPTVVENSSTSYILVTTSYITYKFFSSGTADKGKVDCNI